MIGCKVEFEATVDRCSYPEDNCGAVVSTYLQDFTGKRVIITVQEIPEPLHMEVEAEVRPCGDGSLNGRVSVSLNELQPLVGKKVRLTIEEIQ